MDEEQEAPEPETRISRKKFLATGVAAGAALSVGGGSAASAAPKSPSAPDPPPRGDEEVVLYNGRIWTMDAQNRVVSGVVIRNGRFAEVDKGTPRHGRAIDLKGRTVIPGIIDAHNHIVLVGNRPGWSTLAEHLFTIPDVVALYQARAEEVPAG